MSDGMFRTVSSVRHGYDPDEVDEFFAHARQLYETGPAGTLSGAPKVRAMELIEEVELTRRGLYGGVLGYLDFAGNADFAIAIRTALMRNGTAYVQAGGGVVADSQGPYEYNESSNKAKAVLSAIAAAETLTQPQSAAP